MRSDGPRPVAGVGYASMHPMLARHSHGEAVQGLAKAWGITETRAAHLLENPDEYRVESRARNGVTAEQARQEMQRRDPTWRSATLSDRLAILEAYRDPP